VGRGDIFGILLFIVFLGVSFIGRLMKNQRAGQDTGREPRRQQWPGPTAPPGIPGYPRPMTNSVPRQPSGSPQPPVPSQWNRPPQPMPRRDADDDDEGVSIEGVSVEGPAAGENVQAELARFNQASNRFGQLGRLKTALHAPEAEPAVARLAPDALVGLDDPQSVARAFVLAEVLGKPRALRGRSR
jgi:hypothetical protein